MSSPLDEHECDLPLLELVALHTEASCPGCQSVWIAVEESRTTIWQVGYPPKKIRETIWLEWKRLRNDDTTTG